MKRFIKFFALLLFVVVVDQAIKLWVHYHMEPGMEHSVVIWKNLLKLTYTLNPGMVCGINLKFKYGKLFITIMRILISLLIFWYIMESLQKGELTVWLWGWVLILGGSVGNSIDSVFYGVYLDNAPKDAPIRWFYGQVIDMLHVNLWSGILPSWVPIWKGYYVHCLPIFNIADVAICVGLVMVIYIHSCNTSVHSDL